MYRFTGRGGVQQASLHIKEPAIAPEKEAAEEESGDQHDRGSQTTDDDD
jgi:hypothetical protein